MGETVFTNWTTAERQNFNQALTHEAHTKISKERLFKSDTTKHAKIFSEDIIFEQQARQIADKQNDDRNEI